jgi:methionyl-tRNA synthetase
LAQLLLAGVAWPYANGPRHIGHVAGFGIPSDIWSRWARMAGHDVLMISGTDEHGTPITVEAEQVGMAPKDFADHHNALIVRDLQGLGLSYDLFTRTTTANHYRVVQELFRGVYNNGGIIEVEQMAAFAATDGRSLPDRYIEGTCPHCGFDGARGDQCDNCGQPLDPIDLIEPRSKIDGEPPVFRETTQYALDLKRFADELRSWVESHDDWRPNVRAFSLQLLDDATERSVTRDIGWGVPIPLPQWENDPLKRIYVWFDAVIGYLSASIEWAQLSGDADAWKRWWLDPESRHAYFMGKDNIVFHSFVWPAILAGYDGPLCERPDGARVPLHRPDEIVASEFLTMEGRKFSSSRRVVVYVSDVLERYGPDPLRFSLAAGGPETGDADFTWAEFVRRNNDELVATWGNLVQRVCTMLRRNGGVVPERANRPQAGEELLAKVASGFDTVGSMIDRFRFRQALNEVLALTQEVNAFVSQQAPWQVVKTDLEAALGILSVAYDAVCDLNVMFSPFLPHGAQRVWNNLGAAISVPLPQESEVDGLPGTNDRHRVLTTSGSWQHWGSWRADPGMPLGEQSELFPKIDPARVDEEVARLAASAPSA